MRPCISKRQAIAAGLEDLATDQQAKLQEELDFADELFRESIEQYLAEERENDRKAILAGHDPVRDQEFTRQEHIMALEQLDPPLTLNERLDVQLCYSSIDDSLFMDRQYDENQAWDQYTMARHNTSAQ
jgi:hypothetical protein